MKIKNILSAGFISAGLLMSAQAFAFCGFYVAKADTDLFNQASKVVVVRDEERTVVTMASDYQGEAKDFAIVIPVPTVLQEGQIHVTTNKLVNHLDAYTAPRLVEYYDSDPCMQIYFERANMGASAPMATADADIHNKAKARGVTIEAEYTVGEYDILILSAKESNGLQLWLDEQGYQVPAKVRKVLSSYIKQDMKFFVAKVNLEEQAKAGLTYLRPIQMAFESEKFMLPIRLGTVNAKEAQDMFVFALTRKGRVETANYRTVKMPSNMDVPLFVKDDFSDFYRDMFTEQVKKENNKAVFLEYAWDMAWCDPCAADPLSHDQLRELGVFWLKENKPQPNQRRIMPQPQAADVYVTRLHVRYDADNFPEDLMFQTTTNRQNFQGRYVMRHPFEGEADCDAGKEYFASLPKRFEKEAQALANLTGWKYSDIKERMEDNGQSFSVKGGDSADDEDSWWKRLWN